MMLDILCPIPCGRNADDMGLPTRFADGNSTEVKDRFADGNSTEVKDLENEVVKLKQCLVNMEQDLGRVRMAIGEEKWRSIFNQSTTDGPL